MAVEMICICCPMGCRMTVEKTADGYSVSGNTCPRGKAYAIDEMTAPKRMVTSSVAVSGGNYKTVSVKTASAIPKELIFRALDTLKGVRLAAPVKEGDVIVKDILGCGVDFIATRSVEKA
jgi:hypothetical protein CLOST_1949